MQDLHTYFVLKAIVDEFSFLADEWKIHEQMALFTPDANVITYMGGELFADLKGTAQIEHVFTEFTQQFSQMVHLNGQFMLTQLSDNVATATHYCTVKLVREKKGKTQLQEHIVRYQDEYQKQQDKWRISKRVAHFMLSEQRELVG